MTYRECPVPGVHDVHENMKEVPTLWTSSFVFGTTTLFYSIPDFISCKFQRGVAKAALFAAEAAWLWHAYKDELPSKEDLRVHSSKAACPFHDSEDPFGIAEADNGRDPLERQADAIATTVPSSQPRIGIGSMTIPTVCVKHTLMGAAALAALGASIIWGERKIYRWGERSKNKGIKAAHTKHALLIGGITGLFVFLDDFMNKK